MNLFKELILSAPVGNRLKFGYRENVKITKIDTSIRTHKGLPIKQNTFITLVQIDPKTKKVVAQSEGAFWNLDYESEYAAQNLVDQFTSIAAMIVALGGDPDSFDDDLLEPMPNKDSTNAGIFVATKEGAATMQKILTEGVEKYLVPLLENDALLKCKVITNKKGFFELGREIDWILPMDSEEKLALITAGDKKAYRESLKASDTKIEEPDKVGEKPAEGSAADIDGL